MAITLGSGGVIQNGLVVYLDAGNPTSYPGTGTVWYDLSGNNNNFNLYTSNAFNGTGPKYMDFNGSYGCAKNSSDINLSDTINNGVTYIVATRIKNSTSEWRTLSRSYVNDHHVIIQSGGWDIGMYDNDGAGFIDTGFSQQSLPGYSGIGNGQWNIMYWRWSSANGMPTYQFTYNDSPGVRRGAFTNSNGRYNRGFGSIGAYHNGDTNPGNASQYWGDIGMFMAYNRFLSDDELLQTYNVFASRFGLTPTAPQGVTFPDGTTQNNVPPNLGELISIVPFTSSATWNNPGATNVLVKCVGGGGGAAGYCESGGAGGFSEGIFNVTGVASVSVTVGGGGGGVGYYAGASGGGTSSFGGYISASGGGGANTYSGHSGGHGGSGSGGQVNLIGGGGSGHTNSSGSNTQGRGGYSYFGGGAAQIRNHGHLGSFYGKLHLGAPGAGGPGGMTDGSGMEIGGQGETGMVLVYAYK